MREIGKTSRVLSVYHLFLNCEEVSFQEFTLNFGVSQRTALRDIRLLRQAGVLEVRWDRRRQAFLPVTLEPFPLEGQENKTRQKYLEKLRRLCLLMRRMRWEDGSDGISKVDLYRCRGRQMTPASGRRLFSNSPKKRCGNTTGRFFSAFPAQTSSAGSPSVRRPRRWAARPGMDGRCVRRRRRRLWQNAPEEISSLWSALCSGIWANTWTPAPPGRGTCCSTAAVMATGRPHI